MEEFIKYLKQKRVVVTINGLFRLGVGILCKYKKGGVVTDLLVYREYVVVEKRGVISSIGPYKTRDVKGHWGNDIPVYSLKTPTR